MLLRFYTKNIYGKETVLNEYESTVLPTIGCYIRIAGTEYKVTKICIYYELDYAFIKVK